LNKFILGLGLLLFGCSVYGQTDSVIVDNSARNRILVDSSDIQKKPFDTTRGQRFKRISANFAGNLKKVVGIDTFSQRERPKIVFWRSMLVPSFGQIMNKDYWKVPLVYAGAVGGWYWGVHKNNQAYQEYIGIVEDMTIKGETTRPYPEGSNGYAISINQYARTASQRKRYRDLSWIGIGLGWTLFAVEANVAAHLKTFDISNDISMKWSPTVIPGGGVYTAGVKLTLNFK
jgi:hypothetical protein